MRLFDSNISNKAYGNFSTAEKKIYLKYREKYCCDFRGSRSFSISLIGKAPVGNGELSIKILSNESEIIFDEKIKLASLNKGFLFDVDSDRSRMLKLVVSSTDKSIGKCIISRVIITDSEKIESKIIDKSSKIEKYDYSYIKGINNKIGIIIPYSIYGGAEIYLSNILNELKNSNINFEILYLSKNASSIFNGYKELFIGSVNKLRNQLILNKYSHIIFYNSMSVYRILNSLIDESLIHSKIVEIYHSDFMWSDSISKIKNRSNVNISIRVSDDLLNDVSGLENVKTIPVGINFNRFKNIYNKKLKLKHGIADDVPIIGIVARMSPEKNIDYALSIAAKMNNFLFLFLGKGPMLSGYKSGNNLDNVMFLGHKEKIEEYHSIFDALLLTSKIEGTPISILESMATERVVFSTRVGAISSIINDGENGFFLTGDIDKDIEIIKNNFNNRLVAKNARKSIANHDIRRVAKSFVETLFDKYDFIPDDDPSELGEFI
tara:strand:+ start:19235 stop:20710 length:1476 start_codon:yes stop_codon:yes gene_type:complete